MRLRSGRSAPLCHQALIEHAKAITTRVLHGVHGNVGIAEEIFRGAAALGKDGDADAEGQANFPAADLNGLGGTANNLFGAMLNVSYGAEFRHHNDELVPTQPRYCVRFANRGEQALPYGCEKNIAVDVAERIVDLLEPVDVNEEDRSLLVEILCSKDRLVETLVEQGAIGEAGQVIVKREIVDVIRAAAVLGDIAAGNGDSVAQSDDLDIQPGVLDHVVVDEDITRVGNAGADYLTIFVDEAGLNHKGPNFGEDFAIKGFAGHAEPTFGIRVDVAESEVDNGAGGIRNPIEDVEVVQSAFSSSEESRVVRRGECVYVQMPSRKSCLEKSEAAAPEIFREYTHSLALPIRENGDTGRVHSRSKRHLSPERAICASIFRIR